MKYRKTLRNIAILLAVICFLAETLIMFELAKMNQTPEIGDQGAYLELAANIRDGRGFQNHPAHRHPSGMITKRMQYRHNDSLQTGGPFNKGIGDSVTFKMSPPGRDFIIDLPELPAAHTVAGESIFK